MKWIEGPLPDSPEWQSARPLGIGGSEICAAAGERLPPQFRSRYSTRYELVAKKLGLLPRFEGNATTRRGKRAERFVIDTFLEEMDFMEGVALARYPVPMLRHPTLEWLFCTPDALLSNNEGLEAKTSTYFAAKGHFGEFLTDEIPNDYLCQAQLECEALGVDVVHVPLMLGDWQLHPYRVVRNQSLIDALIDAAQECWEFIVAKALPEPTWTHDGTLGVVKALNREIAPGALVPLSAQAQADWAQREKVGEKIKDLKAEQEMLTARVLLELGDAEAGDIGTGSVLRRKLVERKAYTVEATSFVELRKIKLATFLGDGR